MNPIKQKDQYTVQMKENQEIKKYLLLVYLTSKSSWHLLIKRSKLIEKMLHHEKLNTAEADAH